MRRKKKSENNGFNVWRSYSDMMAGVLLLFVLIMCVSLFQAQVNYEASIKERDEKLYLQDEYTKKIMSQEDLQKAESFCEDYKVFLDRAKTEREAVEAIIGMLKGAGYEEFVLGAAEPA